MLIKLNKITQPKIWGSEQWLISAHEHGQTKVMDGDFQGLTLSELFTQHPELFGNSDLTEFPLLVKIIEAKDDLSIQVHPDDEYSLKHENSLGKNECWYVLDCEENSDIIVGHSFANKDEMLSAINDKTLEAKLGISKIANGDFFNIPAGTVHAIRGGSTILEVQQSSDVTYRLYDYNRLENGVERELHIDKSLDVINFSPFETEKAVIAETDQYHKISYVDNNFFTIEKLTIKENFTYENKYDFILGVALSPNLTINGEKIDQFTGFIVPNKNDLAISGNGEIYLAYIK